MGPEQVVYCLTRDRQLAGALDVRLADAIAFFYNDAARLHEAVRLRTPDVVVVDTDAIRPELGDAGLGPVVGFLRRHAESSRLGVRPAAGSEWLVAAEAGPGVTILPADRDGCAAAVADLCARG
jgi:hypothetical protein